MSERTMFGHENASPSPILSPLTVAGSTGRVARLGAFRFDRRSMAPSISAESHSTLLHSTIFHSTIFQSTMFQSTMPKLLGCALMLVGICLMGRPVVAQDEDPVFSGPQVGEPLLAFDFEGLLDRDSSETIDFVTAADGGPLALIFLHELTRPGIGLIRAITTHVETLDSDDLSIGLVMLTDDVSETRNWAQRARSALPEGITLGVYPDGLEGPGSYGLNRNVSVTILVADENEVVANFALVQPSIEVDGIKIASSINEVIGREPVSQEHWRALTTRRRGQRMTVDAMEDQYRRLMRPVIQRDADEATIDAAAARVEEAVSPKRSTPRTRWKCRQANRGIR